MLHIDYDTEDFPADGSVANGPGTLVTSWNELLWAAVTVGRPNRQYVFKHGVPSIYEALFRWSLVRMAVEQSGPKASRLRRTAAARTLDPSEKGAVNYFLGLAICKLFASRLLDAPWLLHLDVFRPALNAVLTGRSRPDLVGQTMGGSWVALECKGRVSPPSGRAKDLAKGQAERITSVNGEAPAFHVGGIAFFKEEVLRFYWRDPDSDPRKVRRAIEINVDPAAWRYYYAPTLELIRANQEYFVRMQREPVLMPVESADVEIGVHPEVLRFLASAHWVRVGGRGTIPDVAMPDPYQADGIAVVAGKSWLQRFEEAPETSG